MIHTRIENSIQNLLKLQEAKAIHETIEKAIQNIITAIQSGHKILICGNGGSAADAQHFAGDLLGRFYKNRKALPCIALTTNTSALTAIANDYSYEDIFSRQVEGLGKAGDILIGISTSGSSKNVWKAFQLAKEKNIQTLLLTGHPQKEISQISDLVISVPSSDTPRIQEMLLLIEHIICEMVEKAFEKEP